MRRITRMAGLALVAALAASCATSSPAEPAPGGSPPTTAVGAATGAPAPLVSPLLDGGSFDLATELAAAPVAMWFWAPG